MTTKKKDESVEDRGPWWVEDSEGNRFVWPIKDDIDGKALKIITDESPYDRNGGFRAAEPKNPVDPTVTSEGEVQ